MKRGNARVAVRHRHPQPKLRGIYAAGARRCANVYGLGHYRPRTMKDSVRKVASGRQRTVSERPGRKPAASKRRAALVIGRRERLVAEIAAIRKLGPASDLTAEAEGGGGPRGGAGGGGGGAAPRAAPHARATRRRRGGGERGEGRGGAPAGGGAGRGGGPPPGGGQPA